MLSMRQKTIVRHILGHPAGVSGHQLSQLLRVSGKTVRNDIADINRWMKNFNLKISSSQKEGYFIEENIRNEVLRLLEGQEHPDNIRELQTPQERRLALLDRILGRPGIRLDRAAELFCVSEQTLYKDFVHLERELKEVCGFHGLVMQSRRLYLNAEEYEVRRFIFRFIASRMMDGGQLMDNLLIPLMRGIVNLNEVHTFYQHTLSYVRENHLAASDAVLFITSWMVFYTNVRREEAFMLEETDRTLPEDMLSSYLKYMNRVLFLEFDACDFAFLYDFLLASGFPATERIFEEETLEIGRLFLETLEQQSGIIFKGDEEGGSLYHSFLRELEGTIRRVKLGAQLFDNTSQREVDTLSEAFQTVLFLIPVFEERYDIQLTPAELRRLSGYTVAVRPSTEPSVRIQMIGGSNESFSYRVRRWIRENFPSNMDICGVCPQYLLEDACRENQPDILLAAVPVNICSNLPQVTLSAWFTEGEGAKLLKFMEELTVKKQTAAIMERFFSQTRILFLEGEPAVEEMVRACSHVLFLEGATADEEVFFHRLMKRFSWYPPVLSSGFCFLRPMEKQEKKDAVCVAVSRSPKAKVRVLIAGAFAPGEFAKQEAIYSLFRRLWNMQGQIQLWQKAESPAQVLALLEKSIQKSEG